MSRSIALVLGISFLGVCSHLIPHEMGVSTVGAVSLIAAAYLPRSLMLIPVLITVLVADAVHGFYGALAMFFVYLGHLLAAVSVRPVITSVTPVTFLLACVAQGGVFYLISNLTPMAMGFYPATLEGWVSCYVNGLPFLLRGVMANLVFGGIAFLVIWYVKDSRAYRIFTTQRH